MTTQPGPHEPQTTPDRLADRSPGRTRRTRAEMLELVASRHLRPLEPYPGPHARWKCLCLVCGRTIWPRYSVISRKDNKTPCRPCAKDALADRFRLPADEARRRFLAADLFPLVPYENNHVGWEALCLRCGELASPALANVQQRGGGCDTCARAVRGAKKRLPEEVAVAVMVAADLTPLEPYPGSGVPWRCLHACGREVTPTYDNVKAIGAGCRPCGTYGLGWDDLAVVYLLVHPEHLALKVGVAKQTPTRASVTRTALLAQRYGWVLFRQLVMPTGRQAYAVERQVLAWWRTDLGLPAHLGPADTQGHTETVCLEAAGLQASWQRIVETADRILAADQAEAGAGARDHVA